MINPYLYYRIKESIKERDDSFGRVYRKNRQLLDEKKKVKLELEEIKEKSRNEWIKGLKNESN